MCYLYVAIYTFIHDYMFICMGINLLYAQLQLQYLILHTVMQLVIFPYFALGRILLIIAELHTVRFDCVRVL